jgi:hypothetical protein
MSKAERAERFMTDGNQDRRVCILAAFDRRHLHKFRYRFLRSLRRSGNQERVVAFGYGLYPSEQRQLRRLPGVELIPVPSHAVGVAIRRLFDFQGPLKRLPSDAIVAYWDAGDVIFQDRLTDLWALASDSPERLLVVEEPWQDPKKNNVAAKWTSYIHDPVSRRQTFDLLTKHAFLNSGFAVATVGTMLRYLQHGHELCRSSGLRGIKEWGDQVAMNIYCHTDPRRYHTIGNRWNYCLCGRDRNEFRVSPAGRFVRLDGRRISVVHGNARTLERIDFLAPVA